MAKEGVERCHYLKLDCEGAEYDIVGSLSFEVAECIEQITMEIHEVPGASPDAHCRSFRIRVPRDRDESLDVDGSPAALYAPRTRRR